MKTLLLNINLSAFALLSCINFFGAFFYEHLEIPFAINSWILVISGILINAGTIIQVVFNIIARSNMMNFNYLTCLVCGCFLLVSGQLFTYVHKNIHDWDFLISMLGSMMSFIFTMALLITNRINEYRERNRISNEECQIVSIPHRYADKDDRRSHHHHWVNHQNKRIVYYEGTSGVGKTTSAPSGSYDYLRYLNNFPEFMNKTSFPYLQTCYNMQLYADIYLDIMEFSRNGHKQQATNDRFIFSQLAYDIIFQYNGHKLNPEDFKRSVDLSIFNKPNITRLIKTSMLKIMESVETMAPNIKDVDVIWFISKDPEYTKIKIEERGTFETRQQNWNLLWYIKNQNYVFCKLQQISGIGRISSVKLINIDV